MDCGTHAVKVPGRGFVDPKVHVASSHVTHSAGRLDSVDVANSTAMYKFTKKRIMAVWDLAGSLGEV